MNSTRLRICERSSPLMSRPDRSSPERSTPETSMADRSSPSSAEASIVIPNRSNMPDRSSSSVPASKEKAFSSASWLTVNRFSKSTMLVAVSTVGARLPPWPLSSR